MVSPKSYRNTPRVNLGQEAGSLAIARMVFPASKFNLKNGSKIPVENELFFNKPHSPLVATPLVCIDIYAQVGGGRGYYLYNTTP